MIRFADLTIRRKLLLMTLASSAPALLLASSGFLAWDIGQFRSDIRRDILAQSRIIADNSGAAITFGDERTAGETLAALQLRPHVQVACLYTQTGRLFATYRQMPELRCPPMPADGIAFARDTFEVAQRVVVEGDRVGTIYISRDLDDLYERLRIGAGTVFGLLILAIVTSFLISARMQRAIASPLLHLADTARAVSASRNYSLRAESTSGDEVGVVVHAFNEMLDRIDERTRALSEANAGLEREMEERRRAEGARIAALDRERDANRLKDEFLATLSHELRTPLNAVLGWVRVLRTAHVEPSTQARALESIERNAHAQVRLIEDILEISRIVTGKLRLQVREIDLAAHVEAAVEVVQPGASAKQIQLTVEIQARPAMTSADPDRLQQVVWNLLSNAVKFTPIGGRIAVVLALQPGAGYRLTVSDTGAGIDARFLPYLFEPFRQADGSASREHGGLGLGLAIAKQLVELHGGTITAESRGAGTGATFQVTLPSVLPAPAATGTAPAASTPDRERL